MQHVHLMVGTLAGVLFTLGKVFCLHSVHCYGDRLPGDGPGDGECQVIFRTASMLHALIISASTDIAWCTV